MKYCDICSEDGTDESAIIRLIASNLVDSVVIEDLNLCKSCWTDMQNSL